jgi:DNA repair protein RecN (Recombination protein N)
LLTELRVRQLGVIEDATLVLGPGMTVLTGETGAGKTLLVEAISLLTGGAASHGVVRPGSDEATVEARFAGEGLHRAGDDGKDSAGDDGNDSAADDGNDSAADDGTSPAASETALCRVIPASGRSRAYLDGRMVPATRLAESGAALVDLHGQHTHQSLLSASAQRRALDVAGGIDASGLAAARQSVRSLREQLGGLGGDARARARELDMVRHQADEIERAHLRDPDEDQRLLEEEDLLSDAAGFREAALGTWTALNDEGGLADSLAELTTKLAGRAPLAGLRERLSAAREELVDAAGEARMLAEGVEDDPERLEAVRGRRLLLRELCRRYGDTLAAVMAFHDDLCARIEELESHEARASDLERLAAEADEGLEEATRTLYRARVAAAPDLARAVTGHLHELAMPKARFGIEVEPSPEGGTVTWMLAANPGQPMLPLSRVASGGELARTMLAARLAVVLAESRPDADATDSRPGTDSAEQGPATLVFDEVDAGVGGEAAVAVGRALHDLADRYQVLVVTHLPQVAAFAEHHLVVRKAVIGGGTIASVAEVSGSDRVVELARMLSGRPDSETARLHALELLGSAGGTSAVG